MVARWAGVVGLGELDWGGWLLVGLDELFGLLSVGLVGLVGLVGMVGLV